MKKILSKLVGISLITSSVVAAEIDVSGEASVYMTSASNGGTSKDSGYTMTSIELSANKELIKNLDANLGFRSNHKISEQEEANYDETTPKSTMHTANITYKGNDYAVVLGRQEIDLEWISDYHEALIGVCTAVENTTIILGHTKRFMTADNDAALQEMSDINGSKGASVIDVSYMIDENTNFGAYYMTSSNLFSAYGLKANLKQDKLNLVVKYAVSSEDVSTKSDGSIGNVDLVYKLEDNLSLIGGYIFTDKNGGIGSLDTLGENINPLDTGNRVYSTDAQTFYLGGGTSVSGYNLALLYATTDYSDGGVGKSEDEINITIEKEVYKDTKLNLLLADISADSSNNDSTYFTIQVTYSF